MLATRLGVPYLDTGAMYRAVGLAAKRRAVTLPIAAPDVVVAIANASDVRVTDEGETFLDGEDVSTEIRAPEISVYASAVSALPGVRRRLAGMQRQMALEGGGVLEGRDIGTKVIPEAPFKFFLIARPEVRAERRCRELQAKGTPQAFEMVLREMVARDEADSTRADSPLVCNESYVRVDTSDRDAGQVVDLLVSHVASGEPSQS